MKRTCIKSLPGVLVIHLMRFGFDWESGRSIKYDEQIRVSKRSRALDSRARGLFNNIQQGSRVWRWNRKKKTARQLHITFK